MGAADTPVLIVGGGVVGCAVLHALARRGVAATLIEQEAGLGLAASGTNSGILHTGFDSKPGELETALILRSAKLRERLIDELGVPVLACGARLGVGVGLFASPAAASELLPGGALVEPGRDDAWRNEQHERWRAFVVAAAAL
jgi:glycine/D-amino acid oxidase-like deaminating enzyme